VDARGNEAVAGDGDLLRRRGHADTKRLHQCQFRHAD
jgi:hypothetical protein